MPTGLRADEPRTCDVAGDFRIRLRVRLDAQDEVAFREAVGVWRDGLGDVCPQAAVRVVVIICIVAIAPLAAA